MLQDEEIGFARFHDPVCRKVAALLLQRNVTAQNQPVRSRNGVPAILVFLFYTWLRGTVIETGCNASTHMSPALDPSHDPYYARVPIAFGHEVSYCYRCTEQLGVGRLEHHRPGEVTTRAGSDRFWTETPVTVLLCADKARETSLGIEVGPA